VLGAMSFIFSGWSDDGSFSVCSTENVFCSIRVIEDAFGIGTSTHGGLNIDDTDKSSGHSSKETEEKGVRKCGATDGIVLWPKGILVGLAASSRLGAYDAVCGDFLEFCHIQDSSPVTPHPDDIGYLDSFVQLTFPFVSPQMTFINLGNSCLVLPYPISQI